MFSSKNLVLNPMTDCIIHINSELEAIFVRKGCVKVVSGNSCFELRENQMTIIPPYRLHGFEVSEDADALVYMFTHSMASDFFKICQNKDIRNSVFTLDDVTIEYIESATKKFIKEPGPFLEKSLFYTFLAEFTNDNCFVQMSFDDSNANRIIEYIYRNIKKDITVKTVAAEFAVSEASLNEILDKYIGLSFKNFLGSLRIKYATELLASRDLNVTEIAYECGYETPRTFNRMFLKIMGCTPTEYRKQRYKAFGQEMFNTKSSKEER